MPADPRFLTMWGEDEMIPYPREAWLEHGIPADMLPTGDEVPLDVAVVYTGYLTGDVKMYDTVRLTSGNGAPDLDLWVVGALPGNTELLYMLEARTGAIVQFDLAEHDLQPVNTSYRLFAEFLYHFARFVEADEGRPGRAERAAELSARLRRIDPDAFRRDGWWTLVFAQIE